MGRPQDAGEIIPVFEKPAFYYTNLSERVGGLTM